MNVKTSKSISSALPFALRAHLSAHVAGPDGGGGGAPAPLSRVAPPTPPNKQLAAGVGAEWLQHPRARAMAEMLNATVGAQGIGGDMIDPQRCIPGYPNQVVQSMAGIMCDLDNLPPGVDRTTAAWFMSQVNLAKYAVAPTRLGWLCDSISFVTPAIGGAPVIAANAVVNAFNLTPTRSFTMDALVLASGTSNDPDYYMTQFTYQGTNFVGTGSWIAQQYTPTSGCCLCVRVVPIVEKNTSITIGITNGNVANVFLKGSLFGYTLFSGSP